MKQSVQDEHLQVIQLDIRNSVNFRRNCGLKMLVLELLVAFDD